MILPDVNVLVYAHRQCGEPHCLPDLVGEASRRRPGLWNVRLRFERLCSDRYQSPSLSRSEPDREGAGFRGRGSIPFAMRTGPTGTEALGIFRRLCVEYGAKGNLVPDAFLAALAIEQCCEWITTDRDYARFTGLKWRHPLG